MDYVYIKSYGGWTRQTYHTDPNCHLLSDEYQTITTQESEKMDLDICSYCDGSINRHRGESRGESIPSKMRNGRYEKK